MFEWAVRYEKVGIQMTSSYFLYFFFIFFCLFYLRLYGIKKQRFKVWVYLIVYERVHFKSNCITVVIRYVCVWQAPRAGRHTNQELVGIHNYSANKSWGQNFQNSTAVNNGSRLWVVKMSPQIRHSFLQTKQKCNTFKHS